MKTKLFLGLVTAAVLSLGSTSWAQPTCENDFQPTGDEGDWDLGSNWSEGHEPTSSEVACIPPGKTAHISVNDNKEAEAIWVKASGPTLGRLEIIGDNAQPTSLKIFADSRVDGELVLRAAPRLIIDGSVTIDGTGQILLIPELSSEHPSILGSGTLPELTLKGKNAGTWTPDDWDDRTNTLLLYGGGMIDVALVNKAHVSTWEEESLQRSYGADATLTINKSAKGDGFWIAEINSGDARIDVGILDFKAQVTEDGTWVVVDSAAEIRINAASTSLTGDVLVYDGMFLVRQNFETTGDLTLEDQGRPEIVVRQGKVAKFNKP